MNIHYRTYTSNGKMRVIRLYQAWRGMRARCLGKNRPDMKYYRSRGIRVCKEWEDFWTFRKWALRNGYRKGLSIDRVDNNGNYSPDNCQWTDSFGQQKNQSNNKCYTHNGVTLHQAEWARRIGIDPSTLIWRIRKWGLPRALEAA